MKATGIVRRIDARVIIRQKPTNCTDEFFYDFVSKNSESLGFYRHD